MTNINIFYEGHTNPNGAVTTIEHMAEMLQIAGYTLRIFKLRKVRKKKLAPLCHGSQFQIQTVTIDTAMEIIKDGQNIVGQLPFSNVPERREWYKLMLNNSHMPFMIHGGPGSMDEQLHLWTYDISNSVYNVPITFRRTLKNEFDTLGKPVVFMPHPYVRKYSDWDRNISKHAVNIGRVSSEKNTDIICAANELLSPEKRIEIWGDITGRMYAHYKLDANYIAWKVMHKGSPHRYDLTTANVCRDALFAIDLTSLSYDGGGSQYSFFEAMDAGAVLIIHGDWAADKWQGEMRPLHNCLNVYNAEELAEILHANSYGNAFLYDGYEEFLYNHSIDCVLPHLEALWD